MSKVEKPFSSDVCLTITRVCHGFRQRGRLTILDTVPLRGVLCCRTAAGKHYHIGMEAVDEDASEAVMDSVLLSPDGATERILREMFDPLTREERDSLEVQRRKA